MKNVLKASLTRIADLEPIRTEPRSRGAWATGDYVVVEILRPPGSGVWVELASGRQTQASAGDRIVGALGAREATLEITGTWEAVGDDGHMHVLTAAGLLGKLTSLSTYCPHPMEVEYVGHVVLDGRKATMGDFGLPSAPPLEAGWAALRIPTILIVGSSMSAGKTSAARNIVRRLKVMDRKVAGIKLTGAGRYRDILTMRDAGADWIFDFVDVGLPSTVCPSAEFRARAATLLGAVGATGADVAVIEAGASPLEAYNGEAAVDLLAGAVNLLVLCASDPYAVVGIEKAFGRRPDIVGGAAANTSAGRALVHRLTGLPSLDFTDGSRQGKLDALLREALG